MGDTNVRPDKPVFISYSSRDREDAFALKRLLEADGLAVWLDFFDIRTTAPLRQELDDRVRGARLVCLLLSPSAVASPWVGAEISTALAGGAQGLRLLPVLLRPCRIPDTLADIVGFDATEGLDREAVRLRLLRAIRGEAPGEERLLLDAATRALVEDRETVAATEAALPELAAALAAASAVPLHRVALEVHPDTLPDDPAAVLELRLEIDTLFHGAMSLYVARWREGRTWPAAFGLREPPFTEFLLSDRPRLDVQLKWFDRVVALVPVVDGTDLKSRPPTFTLEFDGQRFQPSGALSLPQDFEIPSLDELDRQRSRWRLVLHDPARERATEVPDDTDIDLRLVADAPTATGTEPLVLFASRRTPRQRVALRAPSLQALASPIRRAVLLARLQPVPANGDERPAVAAAIESGRFESDRQRRQAARWRYGEALLARQRTLHRDAYHLFQQAAELLQPLALGLPEGHAPALEDASLIYRCCRALVGVWARQESWPQAAQMLDPLQRVAAAARDADPGDADFQRHWADAMRLSADVHLRLGDRAAAATALRAQVDTLGALLAALPTPDRQRDALAALARAARDAVEAGLDALVPLAAWRATLAAAFGDAQVDALTAARNPDALPAWLASPAPDAAGPTTPLADATLRVALHLPAGWNPEPDLMGSAREVTHHHRGPTPADWLQLTFMGEANDTSDMANWIEPLVAMSGFPAVLPDDAHPRLLAWNALGKLPALARRLAADEAHAWVGRAEFRLAGRTAAACLHAVLARRRRFAWKIVLALESTGPGGDEADAARAAGVLGALVLDPKD